MSDTLLMVADSEREANMLYATGLFVPDPFIYLNFGRRPLLVLSDLEIDRARAAGAAVPRRVLERLPAKTPARRREIAAASPTSSAKFCARTKSAAPSCRTIFRWDWRGN